MVLTYEKVLERVFVKHWLSPVKIACPLNVPIGFQQLVINAEFLFLL